MISIAGFVGLVLVQLGSSRLRNRTDRTDRTWCPKITHATFTLLDENEVFFTQGSHLCLGDSTSWRPSMGVNRPLGEALCYPGRTRQEAHRIILGSAPGTGSGIVKITHPWYTNIHDWKTGSSPILLQN